MTRYWKTVVGLLLFSACFSTASFALSPDDAWQKLRSAATAIQTKSPADWTDFECAFFFHGYLAVNKMYPEKDYSGYFKNTGDGPQLKAAPKPVSTKEPKKAGSKKSESVEEQTLKVAIKEVGKGLADMVTKSGSPASWGKGPSMALPPWFKVLQVALKPSDTSANDDNLEAFFANEGKTILIKKGEQGLFELIQVVEALQVKPKPAPEPKPAPAAVAAPAKKPSATPAAGKSDKDVGAAYDLAAQEMMKNFMKGTK